MRKVCTVIALVAVTLLLAGCNWMLVGCRTNPAQQQSQATKKYQLRGSVLEVLKEKRELRIKHEDIPGYMRGMTMNFPVRDDAALATLAPGDQITAELNVAAPGEYWLANIRKTAPANPKP